MVMDAHKLLEYLKSMETEFSQSDKESESDKHYWIQENRNRGALAAIQEIQSWVEKEIHSSQIVDIIFSTDEPICPCCNEFMERRSAWDEEDLKHCPPGKYVCKSCGEAADAPSN